MTTYNKGKVNYIFDVLFVQLEPPLVRRQVLAARWHYFKSKDRVLYRQTLRVIVIKPGNSYILVKYGHELLQGLIIELHG